MGSAKEITLRPIERKEADKVVKRLHYSGKVVNNSQLSIGVFYQGKLEGAMQFGPSLDKRKLQGLVTGTGWNDFIELNRMAFSDALPRNSESRAIAVAMRLLKKHAPHLQWVISFADATQCGDGTIYRASGFVLTGIKKNDQIWAMPDHQHAGLARTQLLNRVSVTKGRAINETGGASMQQFIDAGARPLDGYQLRYLYFLDLLARERLTVPTLPFSAIAKAGAQMYRGQKPASCDRGETDNAPRANGEPGGASPTRSLPNDSTVEKADG